MEESHSGQIGSVGNLDYVGVKAHQFSFTRLGRVAAPALGMEMSQREKWGA